jgi:hypothetical protein
MLEKVTHILIFMSSIYTVVSLKVIFLTLSRGFAGSLAWNCHNFMKNNVFKKMEKPRFCVFKNKIQV